MEYTIKELTEMSGVTKRTLRYYDQIGLLCSGRISNGYRVYGQAEVDRLQQILFYKELDVPLVEIEQILGAPDYDREKALSKHLSELLQKKNKIELLINNVTKTIESLKGENLMNDQEKFEGFKQKIINDNETVYGSEIRAKYGDSLVDASNTKIKGMSEEKWQETERLRILINEMLKKAFAQGDPENETAQKVCELHRQWICMFWQDGTYSKEAHLRLAEMYCVDERFKKYYEAAASGATEFLFEAMKIYCK